MTPHVLIVGAGVGGLCLAQGLKKAGISFAVYERDASEFERKQGFRLHIDPKGSVALKACLPDDLFDLFDATCGQFGQGFTLMTEDLREILSLVGEAKVSAQNSVAIHRSVHRMVLRRILLDGLADQIHFGKRLSRYEEVSGTRVRAHFDDGSFAEGDLLIGADGVNSRVRGQFLPAANPIDTGVVALGGRVPLSDGVLALVPSKLLDGPVMITPEAPVSLFLALWKRSDDGPQLRERFGEGIGEDELEDHVIVGFGARLDYFNFRKPVEEIAGKDYLEPLRRITAAWNPNLRKLVELIDPKSLGLARIRSSEPVVPWPSAHITLLGDAIHSMTPYRGIGANVALRDAGLLCSKLIEAVAGAKPLLEAVAEYEAEMRVYAFQAVKESRSSMEQMVGTKGVGFKLAKTAMRVVNSMPSMKRAIVAKMNG